MTEAGSAIQQARTRARRVYSPAYANVYVRGAKAKLAGKPVDSCPYSDSGWAWKSVWVAGWRSV